MFCTQCGAKASDEARFCTSCGAPLTAAAGSDTPTSEQPPRDDVPADDTDKSQGTHWMRWSSPVVIAVVGYVVAYLAYGSQIEQGTQDILADAGYDNLTVDKSYYSLWAPLSTGTTPVSLLIDRGGDTQRIEVSVYGNPYWTSESYIEISGAQMQRLKWGF